MNEEQNINRSIHDAQEFEMSILVAIAKELIKELNGHTKQSESEGLYKLATYQKQAVKEFKSALNESSYNDIYDNLLVAYDDLPSFSQLKVKPSDIIDNFSEESRNYWNYITSKGTNLVVIGNQNVKQSFLNLVNDSVSKLNKHEATLEECVDKAIVELATNGVSVIDYDSGVKRSVEAWVRQQMIYAKKKSAQEIRDRNAFADGVTIFEFDAHADSRPSHKKWQGKRFDITGKEYPTLEQLTHGEHEDYGCRHIYYPIYFKEDKPMYTKEELKNLDTPPFEFDGKTYTGYEARQKMREYERKIRKEKKVVDMYERMDMQGTEYEFHKYKLNKVKKKYSQFCKAYGTYPDSSRTKVFSELKPVEFDNDVQRTAYALGIKRHKTKKLKEKLSHKQIVERIGGGDETDGSCMSLAFAYVANEMGYDVLDFRGGLSQSFFSKDKNIVEILKMTGVKYLEEIGYNDVNNAKKLLSTMKENKEYILISGRHASIVKQVDGQIYYLELQSKYENGYMEFTDRTFKWRFGITKSRTRYGQKWKQVSWLVDVDDLKKKPEFVSIFDYINTSPAMQKKGSAGDVK